MIDNMSRKSSLEMEGEMVDEALHSMVILPEVVTEVVHMHKDQSSAIQQQRFILQTLKEKHTEGQKKCERTMEDLASVTRRIYLTEDQVAEKKRICEKNERELEYGLSKLECIKKTITTAKEEKNYQLQKLKEYKDKMAQYIYCVHQHEESYPLSKKLKEVNEALQQLNSVKKGLGSDITMSDNIQSGHAVLDMELKLKDLDEECEDVKKRIDRHKAEITDFQAKHTPVKQSIDVLHKRNAALLTRLKRQLKEVQSHNRQWQQQAEQLEYSVGQARKQLEE